MRKSCVMTGAEFKRFSFDENIWNGGRWVEDEEFTIDGKWPTQEEEFNISKIPDSATVNIVGGKFVSDGDFSYVDFALSWHRNLVRIVTDVPKERVDEFELLVKDFLAKKD